MKKKPIKPGTDSINVENTFRQKLRNTKLGKKAFNKMNRFLDSNTSYGEPFTGYQFFDSYKVGKKELNKRRTFETPPNLYEFHGDEIIASEELFNTNEFDSAYEVVNRGTDQHELVWNMICTGEIDIRPITETNDLGLVLKISKLPKEGSLMFNGGNFKLSVVIWAWELQIERLLKIDKKTAELIKRGALRFAPLEILTQEA